jgi:hypothetical protein
MLTATLECLGASGTGPTRYRAEAAGHVVEGVEPVRPLCRALAYAGHAGPLKVHDAESGKLRSTIAKLEEAARWRVWEDDDKGFRKERWRPHPKAPAWEHELYARLRADMPAEARGVNAEAAPALG